MSSYRGEKGSDSVSSFVRLFLIFAAVWAAIRLLARILGAGRAKAPPSGTRSAPERLVQDPSCGVWIPEGRALKAPGPDGLRYYCSERCRAEHSAAG